MNTSKSGEKKGKLEHYISLSTQLEGVVDDQLKPLIRETKSYLERLAEIDRKMISIEQEEERAEENRRQAIRDRANKRGLHAGYVRKLFDDEARKSIVERKANCVLEIAKNGLMAILYFPISLEKSSVYSQIAKTYVSTLRQLNHAAKLMKETARINKENDLKRRELDIKKEEAVHELVSKGVSEENARKIVFGGNEVFYGILDSLAKQYKVKE
jgi:hypothetical protein